MKAILFVCSRNRRRSPTAEAVFCRREDLEVASAGLDAEADNPLTPELVEAADIIFVMEKAHLRRLRARFRPHLKRARVICLDIPDDYAFMEPALVALVEARAGPHLR